MKHQTYFSIAGLLFSLQLLTLTSCEGDIVIDLSDPVIDLSDPVNTQTLNVSEGNDGTLQERSICVLVPSDLSTNALQIMVSPTSTATEGKDFNISSTFENVPVSSGNGMLMPATQIEMCASLTVFGDNLLEGTETIVLLIASAGVPRAYVNVEIQDDDRISVQLEQSTYSVTEGDGTVEVCAVVSSGELGKMVSFTFATQDGSATFSDPQDFSPISVDASFNETTSRACVDISINDDRIFEDSESFTFTISGDEQGVDFVSPTTATVTIVDDDQVTIGFETPRYEGDEGEMVEVCAAVLGSVTMERSVMVRLTTEDSTANASSDYRTLTNDLTFGPTQNRECKELSLLADDVVEGQEQLRVALALVDTVQRVTIDPSTAMVYIMDTNRATIGVETPTYTVNEGAGSISVCAILLTGTLEREVPFSLTTRDGSATSSDPRDFSLTSFTSSFETSSSRACADIPILEDSAVESSESFSVVVESDHQNVDIMPSTASVTIVDNDKVEIGFNRDKYQGDGEDLFDVCGVLRNATLERQLRVQFIIGDEADSSGLIFNSGDTMKCTSIRFGRYESIEMFELSLTSNDSAAIVSNAMIEAAVIPRVVFSHDGLSLDIVLQGFTMATFDEQRQQQFKVTVARVVSSYCRRNMCQTLAGGITTRQSGSDVTADSIVIRDIMNNDQNQLEFKMLVLGGDLTVVPADAVKSAIELAPGAFSEFGFTFEEVEVVTTPLPVEPTTTPAPTEPSQGGLSPGGTTALVVVFTVTFLLVAIFTVIAVFKCAEKIYELHSDPSKPTATVHVESVNMRALAERQEQQDALDEAKEAEAAAERRQAEVSVTIDL